MLCCNSKLWFHKEELYSSILAWQVQSGLLLRLLNYGGRYLSYQAIVEIRSRFEIEHKKSNELIVWPR